MSLIEEAMRKAGLQRASSPQDGAMAERRVRAPKIPPSPVAEVAARPFQPIALDPGALARNHVLPGVADINVLRAYKILRTRVLRRMQAENWRSIGVTGTGVGEGKSMTALNLAVALAQEPSTWVFLVDLDLQRPRIASYLGMNVNKGLSDYLTGQATSLDEVVYDPGIKRLAVIPNARPIEQSSEALSSPRMLEFLQTLGAETPKRLIVFDMPPLLMSDDVLAFAPRTDSFLLVVSQGQTPRSTLENAKEVLADMNLVGVVLNRSTESEDSPYY